ncbi:MAG: hypothetical protein AAB638_03460 [Patescibacteria group bacterium]
MTFKAVTSAQLDLVRKTATDKGIGKDEFQKYGIDGGIIAKALDAIKAKATPIETPKLLSLVATVSVPAVDKFFASVAFGDNNAAGIKFYLGSNFRENFLTKIEENISATELNIHTLIRASKDAPIRAELTPELEETTLRHLYELLKKQPQGQAGALLTNGYANIFYIRDASGNLWAVGARWGADFREWDVDAVSVARPRDWNAGDRVGSRKKVLGS